MHSVRSTSDRLSDLPVDPGAPPTPARPLRVAHVITDVMVPHWASTGSPGASSLLWPLSSFAQYGDRQGFDTEIVTLRPLTTGFVSPPGVRLHPFPVRGRASYPIAVGRLAGWLRRERIDIVHTHLFEAGIIGLAAARLAGTPLTVTTSHHCHELPLLGPRSLTYWLDGLCLSRLADRIIAPCRLMRDILLYGQNVAPDKIAIIHHGLDEDRLNPALAARARLRSELQLGDRTVLGAVGRLYWLKQYDRLLRAFAPVASAHPGTVLLLAGEGPQRKELERLAADLGIAGQVRLLGGRPDIPDLLSAIDLFVHPALSESFGLVLIEAMAAGRPVLSTEVGIAPEALADGEAGRLVPVGDTESLTRSLLALLADRPRWPQMGRAARQRALQFSSRTMVAEYERHYRRWMAPKSAAGSSSTERG